MRRRCAEAKYGGSISIPPRAVRSGRRDRPLWSPPTRSIGRGERSWSYLFLPVHNRTRPSLLPPPSARPDSVAVRDQVQAVDKRRLTRNEGQLACCSGLAFYRGWPASCLGTLNARRPSLQAGQECTALGAVRASRRAPAVPGRPQHEGVLLMALRKIPHPEAPHEARPRRTHDILTQWLVTSSTRSLPI
jgi:hypothetical protein